MHLLQHCFWLQHQLTLQKLARFVCEPYRVADRVANREPNRISDNRDINHYLANDSHNHEYNLFDVHHAARC